MHTNARSPHGAPRDARDVRVFIGSSREGEAVALAIQQALAAHVHCQVWSQGLFGLSELPLESLDAASRQHDFAVLVITPDDVTEARGIRAAAPRDNILFEVGFFTGALGRFRTFLVAPDDAPMRLPTDLVGVTTAAYQARLPNPRVAVGPACTAILAAIAKRGPRPETIVPMPTSRRSGPGTPRPRRHRSLGTVRVQGPFEDMPIVNVSATGALLETSGAVTVGTSLDLALELDNQAVVRTRAQVVRVQTPGWRRVGGIGVTFTDMDVESRHLLETFVGHEYEPAGAAEFAPRH